MPGLEPLLLAMCGGLLRSTSGCCCCCCFDSLHRGMSMLERAMQQCMCRRLPLVLRRSFKVLRRSSCPCKAAESGAFTGVRNDFATAALHALLTCWPDAAGPTCSAAWLAAVFQCWAGPAGRVKPGLLLHLEEGLAGHVEAASVVLDLHRHWAWPHGQIVPFRLQVHPEAAAHAGMEALPGATARLHAALWVHDQQRGHVERRSGVSVHVLQGRMLAARLPWPAWGPAAR